MNQGLQRGTASYGQREVATRSELATTQTSRNVPHRTVYLTAESTLRRHHLLILPAMALTRDVSKRRAIQKIPVLSHSISLKGPQDLTNGMSSWLWVPY
jgi:hypothetical protein